MQAPDAATRDAAQATARIVPHTMVIAMAAGIMVTTILTAVSSAEMTEAESRNAIEHGQRERFPPPVPSEASAQ